VILRELDDLVVLVRTVIPGAVPGRDEVRQHGRHEHHGMETTGVDLPSDHLHEGA
jgi:hypothetical protein